MNVIMAIGQLAELTATLGNLAASIGQVSEIIAKANREGRSELTPEEWGIVTASDDASRQTLLDAITKALKK